MSPQAAGVPTVPGSDGLINNEDEAMEVAKKVCWQVLHVCIQLLRARRNGGAWH